MSLTSKLLITALLLLAGYCGSAYTIMHAVMAPRFEQLEQDLLAAKLDGAERAIADNLADIRERTMRWQRAAGLLAPDAVWPPQRIRPDDLRTLNVVLAIDPDGRIVWQRLRTEGDWPASAQTLLGEEFLERISTLEYGRSHLGLAPTTRAVLLTSTAEIGAADGGTLRLVFGRFLDADLLKAIQQFQQTSVELLGADAWSATPGSAAVVFDNTAETLRAYTGLDDLWGERLLVLKVSAPRTVTEISARTMRYGFLLLAAVGALLLLSLWLLLRRLLLGPLTELTQTVHSAGVDIAAIEPGRAGALAPDRNWLNGLVPQRPLVERKDEIGKLAAAFSELSGRLQRSTDQVWRLAYKDTLTGLANRSLFMERIGGVVDEAGRQNRPFALLFLDLDGFKLINDTLGHDAGDELLRQVALRLRGCVRQMDFIERGGRPERPSTVARFGGDEFVLLLDDVSTANNAIVVAERILCALAEPIEIRDSAYPIGVSIGITLFPDDGDDVETLVKHADMAMYEAKRRGRNSYFLYRDLQNEDLLQQLELERDLHDAIGSGQMRLHYQPQVEVSSGAMIGVEALVRWQHPQRGLIMPDTFIGIAEQSGLIDELGRWVLQEACEQAARWIALGAGSFRIAVNVSSHQIKNGDFAADVLRTLEQTGLGADYLEIELTESMLIEADRTTMQMLGELRATGVRIVIDDFGTGYSSLSRLRALPVDSFKIDRSFMLDIETVQESRAIAAAIITLGRELSLGVVAEGVETEAVRAFLQAEGCSTAQGYLFARPLAAEQVMERFIGVEQRSQDRQQDEKAAAPPLSA